MRWGSSRGWELALGSYERKWTAGMRVQKVRRMGAASCCVRRCRIGRCRIGCIGSLSSWSSGHGKPSVDIVGSMTLKYRGRDCSCLQVSTTLQSTGRLFLAAQRAIIVTGSSRVVFEAQDQRAFNVRETTSVRDHQSILCSLVASRYFDPGHQGALRPFLECARREFRRS
jgi:hypothetical protein